MVNQQITLRLDPEDRKMIADMRKFAEVLSLEVSGKRGLPVVLRYCLQDCHRRYKLLVEAKEARTRRSKKYPVLDQAPKRIPNDRARKFYCHGLCKKYVKEFPITRARDGKDICSLCNLADVLHG